ncbi:hypothetical protein Vafri_19791, partial [Volvox africanus]
VSSAIALVTSLICISHRLLCAQSFSLEVSCRGLFIEEILSLFSTAAMVSATKKSRRSSTTAIPATPAAAVAASGTGSYESHGTSGRMLAEVLSHHLGPHLSQEDLLVCRLVCKDWCKWLPAERRVVVVRQVRLDENGDIPALTTIPLIFGAAHTVSLCISERILPDVLRTATMVLGTDIFYRRIKHLLLTSTSPLGSKSSTWPFGMPYWPVNLAGMQGLESLTFSGRSADADLLRTVAETCTGLTSLVLGLKHEETLAHSTSDQGSSLITRPTGIEAIVKLSSLRRLALTLEDSPWDWDEEELGASAQLMALAVLTGLTELRLGGAAVHAEAARVFLRAVQGLRCLALVFDALSGRLHERRELNLWKQLQHVELRLQGRVLESDIPLLALGLPANLKSLHLRSCTVSAYSLTALSSLNALTELSFDGWRLAGVPTGEADEYAISATVRSALVGLLAGPLGEGLQVLRMDLYDPSKDIYSAMPRLAETWAQGSLRVLHLVNTDGYSLCSTGALASLAGLSGLRDLRVSVKGQACRDDSALRAAWLPPNLTCLELVGVHLPCGEAELSQSGQQLLEANDFCLRRLGGAEDYSPASASQTRGSVQRQLREEPAAAAAADPVYGTWSGRGIVECRGHARLQRLQRLSLHACRYGCCSHLQEALGPLVMPQLTSLELDDVSGLSEADLSGLGALTSLTRLSVCALGHSNISSSSMVHVSKLVGLRQLRWHAGDSLDVPPHPETIKVRRFVVIAVCKTLLLHKGCISTLYP